MNANNRPDYETSDMICSRCHKPYDIEAQEIAGKVFETFLVCQTCRYSIQIFGRITNDPFVKVAGPITSSIQGAY